MYVSESAAVTMFCSEFQVVGVEQRIARPEKSVLWNGTDISLTVEERKVRPQTRAVMRRLVDRCHRAADLERQHY